MAVLATAIGASGAAGDPWRWPAAAAWLMHGDARHLVCDVMALVAIGLWLEPRAGTRRVAAWMVLSAMVGIAAHAVAYPEQLRLFGISGTTYALAFAAACGWALDRAWGVALMAGLIAVLAGEWVRGESATQWATAAAGEVLGAGGGWGVEFVTGSLTSTPRVHVACVVLGVVVGLAARVGRMRRERMLAAHDGGAVLARTSAGGWRRPTMVTGESRG